MKSMGWYTHLLPLLILSFTKQTNAQNEDYYCGLSFIEVSESCLLPCPSGSDSTCTDALGSDYVCYYFTGCAEKIANGFIPDSWLVETSSPTKAAVVTPAPTDAVIAPSPIVVQTEPPTPTPIELVETSEPTVAIETPSPEVTTVETPNPTEEVIQDIPTNKPTRRTKRPTPPPVSEPVVIATPNPTKHPIVTSAPTIGTIETILTATPDELNGSSTTTSTSFGMIFSLRTTPEAPVMEVVGFDFLTASTNNLNFELYTKAGQYSGSKGYYGRWILMGRGSVQGNGLGGLTTIPKNLITPVPIDGLGSTRSFYLSISTKDMVYRTTASGSSPDEVVQKSSSEMELYEGESVHAFPFPMNNVAGAYVGPNQFIGAIHYDTLPCKPFSAYGLLYTLPCPIIPTISPSPTSDAPTTLSPTISRAPSFAPTYYITPEPSYMPTTASPTMSPPPTASPTQAPKEALQTEVNVVLTIRNTLNRNMTADEERSFRDELRGFLALGLTLELDNVRIDKVDMWYQQTVDSDRRRLRKLQKQLASTAITLILGVTYYESSVSVGDVIVDFIEKSEVSIINLFRGNEANQFLYQIDSLKIRIIDQVTLAPAVAPISGVEPLGQRSAQNNLSGGSSGGVIAGITIGALAICALAIGSSYYVFKKRFGLQQVSKRTLNNEEAKKDLEASSDDNSNAFRRNSNSKSLQSSNTTRESSKGLNESKTSRRRSSKDEYSSSHSSLSESSNSDVHVSDGMINATEAENVDIDSSNKQHRNGFGKSDNWKKLSAATKLAGAVKASKRTGGELDDSSEQGLNDSGKVDNWKKLSTATKLAGSMKASKRSDTVDDEPQERYSKSMPIITKSQSDPDESASSSGSSSDSDSSRSSVERRRVQRASDAALIHGKVSNARVSDLSGIQIGDEADDAIEEENPASKEEKAKMFRKNDDNWKKLSKSVTTSSKLASSAKNHRNRQKSETEVQLRDKLGGDVNESSEQQRNGGDKSDNWKKLSTAIKLAGAMKVSKGSDGELHSSSEQHLKGSGKGDNWKKLSTATQLSGSMKHHRTKSMQDGKLDKVLPETDLQDSSYPEVKMAVSSDVKDRRSNSKQRSNRSQSLTTARSQETDLKRSQTRNSSDLRLSQLHAMEKGGRKSSDKKDHWKSLSKSLNVGNGPLNDHKIPPSRTRGNSDDKPQEKWKNLSNSIKAANDMKRAQSSIMRSSDESKSKDNWKNLSKSMKVANDMKRPEIRNSDVLRQSSRRRSNDDLRRSSRQKSSEDPRESTIKSRLASSDGDFRKSERMRSDDLRKSRRSSQDDDLRKSKRRSSEDDLTRSKTKKGSSDNLRSSKQKDDEGDLRESKRRGRTNPRRLNSL